MPTTRAPGEFCWINMITPDPDAARAFFGILLGWEFTTMPGMGFGIKVGGRNIGGLFDQHAPNTPPGTPASIGVMVKVDSADAMVERVRSLGGTARDAFDIGGAGRMAVCEDPNGAQFDVWEPRAMQGTDVDPGLHGAPSWFETLTTDVDRAIAFYEALFGWKANATPLGSMTYYGFTLGGQQVAGLLQITPEMVAESAHWGVYFTVDDVDETEHRAEALGAIVDVPSTDIPGVGRFCGMRSPQGIVFYAITYAA